MNLETEDDHHLEQVGERYSEGDLREESTVKLLRVIMGETEPPKAASAQEFLGRRYRRIGILSTMTVDQIMTGFILDKLGVITPKAPLVVREAVDRRDFSSSRTLSAYDSEAFTPVRLERLIDESLCHDNEKARLRIWARFLDHYRVDPSHESKSKHSLDKMFSYFKDLVTEEDRRQLIRAFTSVKLNFSPKTPAEIARDSVAQRPQDAALNNVLNYVIASNEDPSVAYREGQRVLTKFFPTPLEGFSRLTTTTSRVPILKNSDTEPDIFARGKFDFDRARVMLLKDQHFAILVLGSRNSGKSTFSTRLHRSMRRRLLEDVRDGLLDPGIIRIERCDLDLVSPSSDFLEEGLVPARNNRRWDDQLIRSAQRMLDESLHAFNIVIVDLPGGTPDNVTRRLVEGGHFSMLVNKRDDPDSIRWKRFLGNDDFPGFLMNIQTRIEEERFSGLRKLESRDRGDKRDFLTANLVRLNRTPDVQDDVVDLIANQWLYDYLPSRVARNKRRLYSSLVMAGEPLY